MFSRSFQGGFSRYLSNMSTWHIPLSHRSKDVLPRLRNLPRPCRRLLSATDSQCLLQTPQALHPGPLRLKGTVEKAIWCIAIRLADADWSVLFQFYTHTERVGGRIRRHSTRLCAPQSPQSNSSPRCMDERHRAGDPTATPPATRDIFIPPSHSLLREYPTRPISGWARLRMRLASRLAFFVAAWTQIQRFRAVGAVLLRTSSPRPVTRISVCVVCISGCRSCLFVISAD